MSDNTSRPGPDKEQRDLSEIVFRASIGIFLAVSLFLLGLYSGAVGNVFYRLAHGAVENVRLVIAESANIGPGSIPIHFLQPARKEGSGVTVNQVDDGQLVLMTGFFKDGNALRLIRRNGDVVAQWPASYGAIFPDGINGPVDRPQTDWNIDIHGAALLPDGSVVFNFEYSGLVKLSPCGDVVWTLAHPTHHSVTHSEKGGFWVPGLRTIAAGGAAEKLQPLSGEHPEDVYDELILHVSEDGKITETVSLLEVFYNSGLESMLTSTGYSFERNKSRIPDFVHLNKIAELPASMADAFENFDAGFLVVSSRKYNTLAVIDPNTWRVVWHQTGPFIRQHDPEFLPSGEIAVFNNNAYRYELLELDRTNLKAPGKSNITIVNPKDHSTRIFPITIPGEQLNSVIRGKIDPTATGGFLVTEFEGGRAVEFNSAGKVVWEYINRYDKDFVTELTEARLYNVGNFAQGTWSCGS